MRKILITTSSFNLDNFTGKEELAKNGYGIVLNPYGKKMSEQQISELIDDSVTAMIAGTEPLTAAVLEKATGLKILVRCGIGMDNVDLEAAKKLGIKVFNTPDAPTRAVAELTLGHILSLLRRISESDRAIRNGKWQPLMGSLLYEQTVGILGFGRIGKMVGNLLTVFGAKILIHDDFAREKNRDLNFVSKDEIFSNSDIVTLHLPYSKENHHLVNAEMLSKMKPSSFLVNVSRGGLVDDNALYQAISNNKIAGAALDCFEQEPYAGPLANCELVQLSAHMGSYASQSRVKQEQDSCTILMDELRIINLI